MRKMTIRQYGHSCFSVDTDTGTLVVDPGNLSTGVDKIKGVKLLFISHIHPDHLDVKQLLVIKANNPTVIIIGLRDVLSQIPDEFAKQEVSVGSAYQLGGFELQFFGGKHAEIYKDLPLVGNLGVLINSQFYYPGDSFVIPNVPIELLALPVTAPWQKISEAIDFFKEVRPKEAFPVHDAILSDAGKQLFDRHFEREAKQIGCLYTRHPENL